MLARLYDRLERKHHELRYLFFEITRACNLRCLHCGSDCDTASRGREIDTESWGRIVRYVAAKYPGVFVVLTGGEPLLHPELFRITESLSDAGLAFGAVTNGTRLSESTLATLIDHGLSGITVSLDGPEEAHDWLRNRRGTFRKTLSTLKLISSHRMRHADVVTCVTPRVLERLDETAEIVMASGIAEWRLFRVFPAGRARGNRELLLDYDETQRLLTWIEGARRRYAGQGLSISYACEGWVPYTVNRRIRNPLSMCRAGINIASILADGTVTGCPNNDRRFHIGSIVEAPFDELWEHHFDVFRRRTWLTETTCASCPHLRYCRGSSAHLWRGDEQRIQAVP